MVKCKPAVSCADRPSVVRRSESSILHQSTPLRRSFSLRYNSCMALSWSSRRKFLYTAVASFIGAVLLLIFYVAFFTNAPTCFDGALNGGEQGVDCGGTCALFCREQVRSPVVLWSRSFEVAPGTYTAAAYVQNPNPGAAARNVSYSFQLFDADNRLVSERTGVIQIPPVQTVPFIDPNISVGNRTVARSLFAFSEEPVWYRVGGLPSLRVGNQYLAEDASELSATISNESIDNADKIVVAAVLFDSKGVARAASRSILSRIPRKGSQDVIFTWPGGIPNIIRAEITVLPSF